MAKLILLLVLELWIANCQELDNFLPVNISANDSNKDMYVIHATVYQVGILTNASDNAEFENDTNSGAQEALTFYRTNGSNIDLSDIPTPLLTNVTGQNFVGVAPVAPVAPGAGGSAGRTPWSAGKPAAIDSAANTYSDHARKLRDTGDDAEGAAITEDDSNEYQNLAPDDGDDTHFPDFWIKRSLTKRETEEQTDAAKIVRVVDGNAVIPQEAGIQSVALPPLLTLNNNLSDIPVPIPNTSIVRYARVNTLITSANSTS